MEPELLILLCFAFSAGFVDAIVGGGGLIQLPAFFILFPGLPSAMVLGTNKLASFSGTAVATVNYLRNTKVPWPLVGPAMLSALVFSVLGALSIHYFKKEYVKPLVLVLLVLVFLYTWLKKSSSDTSNVKSFSAQKVFLYSFCIGAVLGFYDGFFGPGTGSFLIALFVGVFCLDFASASVSAKLVNCMTNISALVYFAFKGLIIYELAIPIALANMAGSWLGARFALKKGAAFIRKLYLVVVLGLICKMAYEILRDYAWI